MLRPDEKIAASRRSNIFLGSAKINSAEIANVTVLKPEPAVKIWGNRGCNGVIQVTTKKNNKK